MAELTEHATTFHHCDVIADIQAASIAALEQEMQDMQSERAKVSKLRTQLEQASTRMEQEKAAWERKKVCVALL